MSPPSTPSFCLSGGCLRVTAIVETALDVAKAMVHMHAAGVLHSDLKARNIMLKTTGMEGKGFVGKVRGQLRCGACVASPTGVAIPMVALRDRVN